MPFEEGEASRIETSCVPMPPADVGDHWELAPFVGGRNSWCHGFTHRTHRFVQGRIGLRVASEKLPKVVAINLVESRLSGSHRVLQLIPALKGAVPFGETMEDRSLL